MTTDDSRRVSWLLGLLFGLAGMGSSSAAIALPLMGQDLGVGVGVATWTISLYALMLAVTTAVYGRISDLVGVRIPLMVGIGLMTGGALVAALAPTFETLLMARLFQGAGAAAVPTLGVAMLSAKYDGAVRGLAFGRLAGVAAAVSCLGPFVGGAVEHALGWRAVMALPILGVLVIPFLWRAMTGAGTGASLDILGAVLVAGTAGGLVLLVQSPSTGATIAVIGVVLMVVGTPLVALRVRHRPHGFLPLSVIRNGTVVRSALAASAVPASWFAMLVGVPAVLLAEGWEAWQVGLLLLPSAAVALFVPRVAGPLLIRVGAATSLAIAGLIASGALVLASLGTALLSVPLLALTVILVTVAFGLGQPALSASVGDAVDPEVRGVALGVATLLFLVGGSVGSAVVGGLGSVFGVPASLAVLAVLPLLGLLALLPELRRVRALTPACDSISSDPGDPSARVSVMRVLTGPEGPREDLTDADLRSLYAAPSTPWLRANMVSTLDGAATGETGRSGSINNEVDKRVFDTLRELADAILVGAGTAEAEGYRPADRPIVLVSRSGRVPERLRDAEPGRVLLATCQAAGGLDQAREQLGAEHVLVMGGHRVDLAELKRRLVERGWQHLLCEGGPHVLRDLVHQGVLDELDATVVPRLVGGDHPRITDGPPIDAPMRLGLLLEEQHTLLARWYLE